MTKYTQAQQEAIDTLRQYIKPSSKLIIVITKVSQSGMCRRMKVFTVNKKSGGLLNWTWAVSKACNLSMNDDGLRVGGCGMDMAFWLADHITYYLFKNKNKMKFKGNGGSCLDWQAIY